MEGPMDVPASIEDWKEDDWQEARALLIDSISEGRPFRKPRLTGNEIQGHSPEDYVKNYFERLRRWIDNFVETQEEEEYKKNMKALYDLIFSEIELLLVNRKIDTLVFVVDPESRQHLENFSFSMLYDGNQYLLEKYAISMVAGISSIRIEDFDKQSICSHLNAEPSQKPSVLALGASEILHPKLILHNLPSSRFEIDFLEEEFSALKFFNKNLSIQRLREEIAPDASFGVVHISTHGEYTARSEYRRRAVDRLFLRRSDFYGEIDKRTMVRS